MPPGDDPARGRACLAHINEAVAEVKSKLDEPLLVIAGDFNQWDAAGALEDFVDLKEVEVGPSRGTRSIDRLFINFTDSLEDKGTLPPLSTAPDSETGLIMYSDHLVTYEKFKLDRLRHFEWLRYTYRFYNPESEKEFVDWCRGYDWSPVLQSEGCLLYTSPSPRD